MGIVSFFTTDGIMPKIFGGILFVIGIYIIPRINEKIDIGIKSKYILIAFLIGFFGLAITFENKPDEQLKENQYFVTANKLNVRKGEGANFDVVYQLDKGDSLVVIAKNEEWAEISTSKGNGFVSSKYISIENPEKSKESDWVTYLVIGGIVLFALFSKKGSSSSSGTSSSKSSTDSKPTAKPKIEKPKFICKYCGYENENLSTLTFFSCSKSPSGKHIPYEKGVQPIYYCKHCGYSNKNLGTLTFFSCSKSPSGKHQPL